MTRPYRSPGRVTGTSEGTRIPTPAFPGDTASVPGDGPPYLITVAFDLGGSSEVPWGLDPIDLGTRVVVSVERDER